MRRWIYFLYGAGCYAMFMVTFALLGMFVGNFYPERSIDTETRLPVALAIAIDLALLMLFALQHSLMARPEFKRLWIRIVPDAIERSTYVLASCIVTLLLMGFWQGLDFVIWDIRSLWALVLIWGVFAAGWLMVPTVSLMIHHFDLFGMRQVWLHLRGQPYEPLPFRTPYLYRHVRHPLYIGWSIAFFAIPKMTAGHLLLAVFMTTYMWLATFLEERDLIAHFGERYLAYRRRVPKFIPRMSSGTERTRLVGSRQTSV